MPFLPILVASILGSPHCAAMCGGFVVLYSQGSESRWWPHVWYNVGRLFTYVLLGVLAGLVGESLTRAGEIVGIQRLAAIVLGILLVLSGCWQLGNALRARGSGLLFIHRWLAKRYHRGITLVEGKSPSIRAFVIGLLSTLLPCGWLYSFAAVAGATASLPRAVGVMIIFWLGTLPMMLALGAVAQRFLQRWGTQIPVIAAVLVIVTGVLAIAGHFDLVMMHGSGHDHHHLH